MTSWELPKDYYVTIQPPSGDAIVVALTPGEVAQLLGRLMSGVDVSERDRRLVTTPVGPTQGPLNPNETQLHHAIRTMANHPELRYAPGLGWLKWDGTKWLEGADAELHQAVQDAAKSAHELTTNRFTTELASGRGLAAVAKISETIKGVRLDPAQLDSHRDWIHTIGLTWDLRTGDAWPTNPDELNTRCLQWEPTEGCPEWLDALDRCFPGEPEMISFLQRLVGYGITGRTEEATFVLMHGTGRNGKSIFAETITHAFQEYVQHLPVEVLMSTAQRSGESASPMLMLLRGARIVFTSETERGGRLNEAMVKLLTGGDKITARELRRDPVTFKPEALIFMSTNHKPDIQGTDDGIWERVKLIEWRESFKGREDHEIGSRLKAEAPGIINWALEGAMEWYRDRLQVPERMRADTKRFREDSDFLGSFIPDWVELDETSQLTRAELLRVYTEFAEHNGMPPLRSQATLYRAVEERGAQSWRNSGVRGYRMRRSR